MNLSKDFSKKEFACRGRNCCGHSAPMDRAFIVKLQALRDDVDDVVTVSSGYRCNKHNADTPGAALRSTHRNGTASDLKCKSLTVDEFAERAKKYFKCVLIYHNRIHVDDRKRKYYKDLRNV